MPRHARVVFARVPHHVTQRGNHRERVFFCPGDPEAYLHLLREHTQRFEIDVAAYCLMPNHVHMVVIPSTEDALHHALKAVHGQYARRVNRMKSRTGHLWQDRYYSSPFRACTIAFSPESRIGLVGLPWGFRMKRLKRFVATRIRMCRVDRLSSSHVSNELLADNFSIGHAAASAKQTKRLRK